MFRPIIHRTAVALCYLFLLCCSFLLCCCASPKATPFTDAEISLIRGDAIDSSLMRCGDAIMRVLTIESADDEAVLRAESTFLSAEALMSCDYALLCRRMVATVTHPSQDGVGIAGPQVGLNRRIVAVQRFDKEGEPFEVYANIRIVKTLGEKELGPEGCLSVPDMRGDVLRYQEIVIEYDRIVPGGCESGGCESGGCAESWAVERIQERVSGFTAVIFQHECDHLDGVLYIDRI